MTANHETSTIPDVIDPPDLAVAQASSLVAARTLQERRAAPERITSVGREYRCPSCGSRNVASIAYGLIVAPGDDLRIKLAAGEVTPRRLPGGTGTLQLQRLRTPVPARGRGVGTRPHRATRRSQRTESTPDRSIDRFTDPYRGAT